MGSASWPRLFGETIERPRCPEERGPERRRPRPRGTTGTVVSDHGASKLIEISDDRGVMLDLIEVAEDRLRLITKYSR
jgi:hypothetical protein